MSTSGANKTYAAFADVTEKSFISAKTRIKTRAVMTVIVIFLTFAGIVGVLWVGARDVRADQMSVGALIQFVIYAVMVAGAVGALSEIWGELQRAAGATAYVDGYVVPVPDGNKDAYRAMAEKAGPVPARPFAPRCNSHAPTGR